MPIIITEKWEGKNGEKVTEREARIGELFEWRKDDIITRVRIQTDTSLTVEGWGRKKRPWDMEHRIYKTSVSGNNINHESLHHGQTGSRWARRPAQSITFRPK